MINKQQKEYKHQYIQTKLKISILFLCENILNCLLCTKYIMSLTNSKSITETTVIELLHNCLILFSKIIRTPIFLYCTISIAYNIYRFALSRSTAILVKVYFTHFVRLKHISHIYNNLYCTRWKLSVLVTFCQTYRNEWYLL